MKRNIYLLLTTILSLMNLCCADASQRLVEDSTKQATTMKVDSIKVRVPGKVSIIDDDLLICSFRYLIFEKWQECEELLRPSQRCSMFLVTKPETEANNDEYPTIRNYPVA